jgi:hypothetical protein
MEKAAKPQSRKAAKIWMGRGPAFGVDVVVNFDGDGDVDTDDRL